MSNQRGQSGGGLWNTTRPSISAETQNLLKVMMQESKLTNFQQRTINDKLSKGQSLPPKIAPTFTQVEKKKEPPKPISKIVDPRKYKNGLKSFDKIVESGAYEKSDYKPTMKRAITDKDKERLGKIMAYGRDVDKWPTQPQRVERNEEDYEEPDRFDELQREIQERAEFLEDMKKLGKRKEYEPIIQTEISQKIREMEMIDKERTAELNAMLNAKKS